jgi:hypothetical protein
MLPGRVITWFGLEIQGTDVNTPDFAFVVENPNLFEE